MSAPASGSGLPGGLVVLDASFVIALLEGEPGAAAHAGVLGRGVISALTLGEVHDALSQRAGIDPATTEQGLRALGATLVDLPVAAAAHLPALRAAETTHRSAQAASGEEEGAAALSLAELAVLAHATAAGLPVLTGNTGQAALATHGLDLKVHHYSHP